MLIFAFGSNVEVRGVAPDSAVRRAYSAVRQSGIGREWRISPIYRTPAFPAGAGPDFANAVAVCAAPTVPPEQALEVAHRIEEDFGRIREERWSARTLDIDIIAAGEIVAPDRATARHWRDLPPDAQASTAPEELILPHPRLADRSFVLVPLVDLAPGWVDPLSGKTAAALLAERPAAERASVVPW